MVANGKTAVCALTHTVVRLAFFLSHRFRAHFKKTIIDDNVYYVKSNGRGSSVMAALRFALAYWLTLFCVGFLPLLRVQPCAHSARVMPISEQRRVADMASSFRSIRVSGACHAGVAADADQLRLIEHRHLDDLLVAQIHFHEFARERKARFASTPDVFPRARSIQ